MSSAADARINRGEGLLDLRVLIHGTSPSVHYAAWILSRLGATVLRVGTVAGGTHVRAYLDSDIPELSPGTDADAAVAAAELIIGDAATPWGKASRGAATVLVEAGFTGPEYDGLPESELLLTAAGGAAIYTRDETGMPVYGFGRRYLYVTGLYASIAGLAQVYGRSDAAHPQVTVNALESVVSVLPYASLQFAYNGTTETIEHSGPRFMCHCRDGHIVIYSGGAWPAQAAMLGRDDLVDDERFAATANRFAHADELASLFDAWSAQRTVAEAMEAARMTSVAVAPASTPDDILGDEQLARYQAWTDLNADGCSGRVPRAPYVVDMRPVAPFVEQPDAPGALPLAGVRLLDLTHVWSGPMATRVLGALGAEVFKIEGPRRRDFLRGSGTADVPRRYPGQEFGVDPHNRNAWFNTQNTDKRSVVVDLKSERGVEAIQALAARCDAVISNMRPGALERCGLAGPSLDRASPGAVLVEMPGYGNDGPMRDFAGYGAQFEAFAGAAPLGGTRQAPLITGYALADPAAGLHAALAAVAALLCRRKSGRVPRIQAIQRDGMLALMGEYYFASTSGSPVMPGLNEADEHGVHGVVASGGRYIAIDATGEAAIAALATWHGDQSEHDLAGLQRWCAEQPDAFQAATELRIAGIPAVVVKDSSEVFEDPALRQNGYFVPLQHPRVGLHDHPSLPFVRAAGRFGPRTPAPTFGADTQDVLEHVAGLDESSISALIDAGIVSYLPNNHFIY